MLTKKKSNNFLFYALIDDFEMSILHASLVMSINQQVEC